jgi:hypothetical protein
MFNKYSIIFFISSIFILSLILIEFNTNYKIENFSININNGSLIIGTHNYEHKDIFITFKIFKNLNKKFYMLFADKSWNHLLEPFRPENIEFIYVKENTVDKLSSKLLLGHNIIMYYYYESTSSGPYYIIKNTNCQLYLLKIEKNKNENENEKENKENKENKVLNHFNSSFSDIYINNFMKNFIVSIKEFKYSLNNIDNKKFLIDLKTNLY